MSIKHLLLAHLLAPDTVPSPHLVQEAVLRAVKPLLERGTPPPMVAALLRDTAKLVEDSHKSANRQRRGRRHGSSQYDTLFLLAALDVAEQSVPPKRPGYHSHEVWLANALHENFPYMHGESVAAIRQRIRESRRLRDGLNRRDPAAMERFCLVLKEAQIKSRRRKPI